MLFLESPAGVGFSYSNTSSDAIVGDARTAADARKFLLGFMERFPQYMDVPLYLSGEGQHGCVSPCIDVCHCAAKSLHVGRRLKVHAAGNAWV